MLNFSTTLHSQRKNTLYITAGMNGTSDSFSFANNNLNYLVGERFGEAAH